MGKYLKKNPDCCHIDKNLSPIANKTLTPTGSNLKQS